MNNALPAGEIERRAAFENDLHHLRDRQQVVAVGMLVQCAAFDQLHHDVVMVALDRGIEDVYDVRMVELAHHGRFGHKEFLELAALLIAGKAGRIEYLDRDFAIGERIDAAINHAGGTSAEFVEDGILADVERFFQLQEWITGNSLSARPSNRSTVRGQRVSLTWWTRLWRFAVRST